MEKHPKRRDAYDLEYMMRPVKIMENAPEISGALRSFMELQ